MSFFGLIIVMKFSPVAHSPVRSKHDNMLEEKTSSIKIITIHHQYNSHKSLLYQVSDSHKSR